MNSWQCPLINYPSTNSILWKTLKLNFYKKAGSKAEPKPGAKPICLPWPGTEEETTTTKGGKIADLNNGENVVVSGWGRTSNKNRIEFQKLIRNKIAVKKLQYLKTKTANDLCKEKISQDVNTDLQLCAGGEQGL